MDCEEDGAGASRSDPPWSRQQGQEHEVQQDACRAVIEDVDGVQEAEHSVPARAAAAVFGPTRGPHHRNVQRE